MASLVVGSRQAKHVRKETAIMGELRRLMALTLGTLLACVAHAQ